MKQRLPKVKKLRLKKGLHPGDDRPGNRTMRRKESAFQKHSVERTKQSNIRNNIYYCKLQRIDKVNRRVNRAHIRKLEREEALGKGIRVVYSIK